MPTSGSEKGFGPANDLNRRCSLLDRTCAEAPLSVAVERRCQMRKAHAVSSAISKVKQAPPGQHLEA